jgi:hypothetical protein
VRELVDAERDLLAAAKRLETLAAVHESAQGHVARVREAVTLLDVGPSAQQTGSLHKKGG